MTGCEISTSVLAGVRHMIGFIPALFMILRPRQLLLGYGVLNAQMQHDQGHDGVPREWMVTRHVNLP